MTQHSASEQLIALRIFDASMNRALEAARTIEDEVRFGQDDSFLTGQWKHWRHELAAVSAALPAADRLAARDTLRDVGTAISTDSEQTRDNLAALLQANCERLKQALRTLEESAKLLASRSVLPLEAPAKLEQLRYRCYTLEKATILQPAAAQRLSAHRLYWLTTATEPREKIETVLRAGIDIVQLRDKSATDRQLLERGKMLRLATRQTDTLFVINDRPDIALLCDADGVHVGQEELTVAEVRRIVGIQRLVGVSTHSIEQARQAVLDGASYLGVGPTFVSPTKSFDQFPGLALIRQVAAEIKLPWFAIGGIDEGNVVEVMAAGATRVAVCGALHGTLAAETARKLKAKLT